MPVPSRRRSLFALVVLLALLTPSLPVQQAGAPAAEDTGFARLVREWITAPEFFSPLVEHLPLAAGIPTPKDVIVRRVGAPNELAHTADIPKYYGASPPPPHV